MIAMKFQRLYPCFGCRATRLYHCGDCLTFGFVMNQTWQPLTGSRYDITYISACIHNCNEILTTIPLFSGPGYMTRLLRKLSDCELKIAAVNMRHLWFLTNPHLEQSPHAQLPSLLARLRKYGYNRCNFVVIVCTSWDISYLISTPGWWQSSLIYDTPQISDSISICLSVLPDHENLGIAIGISLPPSLQAEIYVTIFYISLDVQHCICTSG